ncbi:MAG: S9 family peptidase [Steroidobacteraceae bacterium]
MTHHRTLRWRAASLVTTLLYLTATAATADTFVFREKRGALILEGIPSHSPRVTATLEDWLQGRGAGFRDFLPDGSVLITTRFGDVEQIHRLRAPLGAREQLTFAAEPVGAVLANPAPRSNSFVFARDRGGNENAQLFQYDLGTRTSRLLTDSRSRHGGAVWSRDGARLAFHGNARDGSRQDVYVMEPAAKTAARLLVSSQGQTWQPLDWSPDGTKLLLLDYISVTEARLFIAEVNSGSLTPLVLSDNPRRPPPRVAIGGARFSADGRGIWVTTDLGSEFLQLRYLDLESSRVRTLDSSLQWDVDDFEVSADGRWIAYVVNADGYSRLFLHDLGAASTRELDRLPRGLVSALRFDQSGMRLGMTVESPQSPRDAWVYELAQDRLTRWTESEVGPLDRSRFVDATLVRYPSWDRTPQEFRRIPAFVYRPAGTGPHPVVIDIHGGPEGQSRPTFSPFIQYLVNELGYAVIQPNVRGSTGYGRRYTLLDNGRLREDSVRDIGALLVWIGTQPGLDASRVVVMGGSYGGYMVLASLIAFGERLRGGINVVGISNFVTFLESTSGYRRDLRRVEYGDERDPKMRAFLQSISPLTRASALRRPLLVVQGLNDPRVPASESEQLVRTVRANGGEVWYLAAEDEGHGFRKKGNRDFYLKTAATFLEKMRQ